ncbi:MAG TPA: glycosyltransferase family 1 protein [Chitinophagaceae bacterium]|nr:glycosyltransferase family 1 protein [Chitinophagaceae bacterium]
MQNLLPGLFKFYPQHEWIIFLDRKDKQFGFPFQQSNITVQYVWAGVNMFSNLFILPYHTRKYKPDIMIFQTFPAPGQKAISIAFIHDVLFNNYPQYFTWKEKLYFLPLKWLAPTANRIVVTSEFVAKELVKFNYRKQYNEIDIVPLGISTDFKPVEELDPSLLKKVKEKFNLPDSFILFVGRLNARKNVESLLKAIPLLRDTRITVVIVGEADGKTTPIGKILSDPRLQNRVLMTGTVTATELPAIYAMATLFCFPSFAEGFGLPPLEAMAAGVPVVVSRSTSLPEVCGEAPAYIDSYSPENIAFALNHLLEDPKIYQQKRKTGFEQARKYSWDKTAHLLMQSITNSVKK